MNTKARAFVLGMPLAGLGVTRSLGEAGIRVTAVDLTRWLPALFSRYCDTLTCPSPVTDPDALLERLLVAGGRLEHPAVLFPVTDAFVLFASRYRAELERRFLLALPPPSVSEALADKWLQHQLVEGAGIACPRTFLVTGQKPAPRASYRVGIRYLVAAGKDARAFREYYRRGELGPGEWIRSVARARVFPYLCGRDPVPFVAATARALWRRLVSLFKKRGHR